MISSQRVKSYIPCSKTPVFIFRYNVSEEEEKRRNAEHILEKEKEHHGKIEKELAG